ncbi:MAG: hypothetical protein U5L09_18995 [Bacteroidales bacterium]|nr:hypothetical protein [Bacteroidales bacterium]
MEKPLADVQLSDHVVIRPGERVPVDGDIISGSTTVDESMMTGEAMPVSKKRGEKMYGGTMNQDGSITLAATAVGERLLPVANYRHRQTGAGQQAPGAEAGG